MKPFQLAATAILFLLFGSGASALAQEQHEEKAAPAAHEQEAAPPAPHEEAKPPQQAPEARPAPHPQTARPPQEVKPQQHQEARPPQYQPEARPAQNPQAVKPSQQEARPVPGRTSEAQPAAHQEPNHAHAQPNAEQRQAQQTAWQSHRAQHWQSEHRNWHERGGYHGYRIPEQHYVAYFGASHVFPIYSVPIIVVGGYPRFQYEGLWFTVLDPWPGDWADDWFYTDDVYVVYVDDGYYLVNQRYPGVMLAIDVSA